MSAEPVGASCPGGGLRFDIGVDLDGSGALDPGEITSTSYACNAPRRRVVFVSSTTYSGNLGGAAGADTKCQTVANTAPALAGRVFRAWVSDAAGSPGTRFARDGYFVRTDGTTVAGSWWDLTDGTIAATINVTETRAVRVGTPWTGTLADGTPGASTCANWSSALATATGVAGNVGATTTWSNASTPACNVMSPLYCFEQ
jgi:hypothetical protein